MKQWWKSKTVWVQLLALAASIISGVTGQDWLDGETQVIILALLGLMLRWKTDTEITSDMVDRVIDKISRIFRR